MVRNDLSILAAFLAIAEERSFTKAAKRLGVSPSAMSHAIRGLEEGLLDKKMTYEKWDSYTATVRSRFLTLSDLTLARWWARLELVIPHRLHWARKSGPTPHLAM